MAATSKILTLRNPALQILLRRHLLHPSAAAASISAQSLHPQNITPNSSTAINHNFHISNLPLHFQLPIEAARAYSPTPPKEFQDDEDEFDDDEDDEVDIEDLSGSEFEEEDEDVDEDDEVRRPIRK